jgi:hypothetical protein
MAQSGKKTDEYHYHVFSYANSVTEVVQAKKQQHVIFEAFSLDMT